MTTTWKDELADRMPPDWAREIDIFETQIQLKKQGKIDEKVFAETRLRRGAYGQRYDNGQRHDGVTRAARSPIPPATLTKGPETLWDAPGMQRIKIPFGGLTPEQLDVLADLAEEYSDGICHVTTRQDFQLHFVHIEDTPDIMRRLAAVGITTREACGNSVRNVTACPLAGVCRDETFDVTPYAQALMRLPARPSRHAGLRAQVQDRLLRLPRSTPAAWPTSTTSALLAVTREVERQSSSAASSCTSAAASARCRTRPSCSTTFLPEEELLPLAQAICRVFARLGEKQNRARARIKFLVKKLGIEEFKRLVLEERAKLPARSALDRRTSRRCRRTTRQPLQAGRGAERRARARPASTPGGAPTSTRSASPATASSPSPCRSATSPRDRCARWPTSPAATPATRCAPRSSRTSCCAG